MVDRYPEKLGKLLGNLHSLEVYLRLFLVNLENKNNPSHERIDYWCLSVGEKVPKDPFTNFDTLKVLIEKYNKEITDPSLFIDSDKIVSVRDLLAHGRVTADSPDEKRLKIVKFSRPEKETGLVTVTDSESLSEVWFEEKRKCVFDQIKKVCDAHTKLLQE